MQSFLNRFGMLSCGGFYFLRRAGMKCIVQGVLLVSLAGAACGYDVAVSPARPTGGEGFLLTVSSAGADGCEVLFKGKTYVPWQAAAGQREIFLPVTITDAGPLNIVIRPRPGGGGGTPATAHVTVTKRNVPRIHLTASDEKMRDRQPSVAAHQKAVLAALRTRSDVRYWSDGFVLPLENAISTPFALHRQGSSYSYYHKGLDFSAPGGTTVKAANDGRVILSRDQLNIYGNTMIVDHGQGVVTCYFHLRDRLKQKGDSVHRNEVIARVGSSGWATGPHLHFGVYLQGEPVDPVWWKRFTAAQATVVQTEGVPVSDAAAIQ